MENVLFVNWTDVGLYSPSTNFAAATSCILQLYLIFNIFFICWFWSWKHGNPIIVIFFIWRFSLEDSSTCFKREMTPSVFLSINRVQPYSSRSKQGNSSLSTCWIRVSNPATHHHSIFLGPLLAKPPGHLAQIRWFYFSIFLICSQNIWLY